MTIESDICVQAVEENRRWNICGRFIPKDEIVFFIQVALIYIVVITSIVNLIVGSENTHLWIALLSSSLGYIFTCSKTRCNLK